MTFKVKKTERRERTRMIPCNKRTQCGHGPYQIKTGRNDNILHLGTLCLGHLAGRDGSQRLFFEERVVAEILLEASCGGRGQVRLDSLRGGCNKGRASSHQWKQDCELHLGGFQRFSESQVENLLMWWMVWPLLRPFQEKLWERMDSGSLWTVEKLPGKHRRRMGPKNVKSRLFFTALLWIVERTF